MTSDIFKSFLLELDTKMRIQGRKILLLLDNCLAHTLAVKQIQLMNITIHFISPNLTSVLQPCDLGIIRAFKAHYKRLLLLKAEKSFSSEKEMNITMKNAINLSAKAWNHVSANTIANCWGKAGFMNTVAKDESDNECEIELSYLMNAMFSIDNVEEYLYSEENAILEITTEEITNIILCESNAKALKGNENKEDEDGLEENENISLETGIQALKYSIKYLQQNEIAEENELLIIKNILKRTKDEKNAPRCKLVQSSLTNYFT